MSVKAIRTKGYIVFVAGLAGVSVFAVFTALLLILAAPLIHDHDSLALFLGVVLLASVTGLLAARLGILRVEEALRYGRRKREIQHLIDQGSLRPRSNVLPWPEQGRYH